VRVIVETNFLLELALQQSDYENCETILRLAEEGRITLLLPIFALAEAYQSLGEKERRRTAFSEELKREMVQVRRSSAFRKDSNLEALTDGNKIGELLQVSTAAHRGLLEATLDRVLAVADIIPFDAEVFRRSRGCTLKYSFRKPGDAAICASVLHYLETSPRDMVLFVEKDREDFANPDLEADLDQRGCFIEFNVGGGISRIMSALEIKD
jgi:predicted nucleic acid-binding protein